MNVSDLTFFTPITCLCFQNFIKSQISIIYKSVASLRMILLSFLRKLISVVVHGSFLEVPLVVAVAPLLLLACIGIVGLGTRLWGAGTGLRGAGTWLGGAGPRLGRPLLVQLVVDLVGRVDWLRRGRPRGDLVVLWCRWYRLGGALLGRGGRPLPRGLLRWVCGRDFIWVGTVSVVCQVSVVCLLIGRNKYCIQWKFRPHFIFALLPEGEFKTGPMELYIKNYIRRVESGRIQDWANQSQISIGQKYEWVISKLYTVVVTKIRHFYVWILLQMSWFIG